MTPALVLLPGWSMPAAIWTDAAHCCAAYQHHALDLPGHGQLATQPCPDTLVAWATHCLNRAPERAVWLGWSLGGLIALHAALQAPHRIAALILLTTTPRFVQAPDWPAALPAATLTHFYDTLVADPAPVLDQFLALQVHNSRDARATLRQLRQRVTAQPVPTTATLATGLNLLQTSDLRPRLRELQLPTLWLLGERDTLVPATVAPAIAALMPASQQYVIRGSGHAPWLSHPTATGTIIDTFLRDHCRL